jgi:hypothetical protein
MEVVGLKSFVCVLLLILAVATTDPVQAQSPADTVSSVSVQHTVIADTLPPRVVGHVFAAESGEPLAGVQVYFEGTRTGTLTGQLGEFTLTPPSSGAYQLRLRIIGYVDGFASVELRAGRLVQVLAVLRRRPVRFPFCGVSVTPG